ncbi:MAG: ATPase, T2SS/T4P/T4SS family, partial [Thermoguttaceae bacterium]
MAWIQNKNKQLLKSENSSPIIKVDDSNGKQRNDDAGNHKGLSVVAAEEGAAAGDWFLALKRDLHQQVIGSMKVSVLAQMGEDELRQEVRRLAETMSGERADLLSLSERERLVNEVLDETFGLGPLEPLMRNPEISDILINGPKTVYIERRGQLSKTPIAFHDQNHVLQVVQRIVAKMGRRVDETCPMVDARLPDG